MKKLIPLLIFLLNISLAFAQKIAVTETGEEVLLFENGTWEYKNKGNIKNEEIPTNSKKFKKSKESTFLLKSKNLNVGFWLNPKEWNFKKAIQNPDAEYELISKEGGIYGMIISEKIEIPVKTLRTIVLENGRASAPDLQIVEEEYRTVNGFKVLFMKMKGTMQGIKFTYYGYYYSNSNGTVQFITYSSQKLIDKYQKDCDKLLNGFVEVN